MVSPPLGFDETRLAKAVQSFDMAGWASFLASIKGGDTRAQRLREVLMLAYDDVAPAA